MVSSLLSYSQIHSNTVLNQDYEWTFERVLLVCLEKMNQGMNSSFPCYSLAKSKTILLCVSHTLLLSLIELKETISERDIILIIRHMTTFLESIPFSSLFYSQRIQSLNLLVFSSILSTAVSLNPYPRPIFVLSAKSYANIFRWLRMMYSQEFALLRYQLWSLFYDPSYLHQCCLFLEKLSRLNLII